MFHSMIYDICISISILRHTYIYIPVHACQNVWCPFLFWVGQNPPNAGQVFPPPSTEFQRSAFGRISAIARDLNISSPKVAGTFNGGTEPCKAILGMGFPLH